MLFEVVSKYKDKNISLPVRKTAGAAGYDFQAAEDIVVPSYLAMMKDIDPSHAVTTIDQVAQWTKETGIKPTLIPTGVKAQIDKGFYLQLAIRSSSPLKYWLVLANGCAIIDEDYVHADNEGHIFFQVINLSPFDIFIKKGDTIGQGIFLPYLKTQDDIPGGERKGGFGSTNEK